MLDGQPDELHGRGRVLGFHVGLLDCRVSKSTTLESMKSCRLLNRVLHRFLTVPAVPKEACLKVTPRMGGSVHVPTRLCDMPLCRLPLRKSLGSSIKALVLGLEPLMRVKLTSQSTRRTRRVNAKITVKNATGIPDRCRRPF